MRIHRDFGWKYARTLAIDTYTWNVRLFERVSERCPTAEAWISHSDMILKVGVQHMILKACVFAHRGWQEPHQNPNAYEIELYTSDNEEQTLGPVPSHCKTGKIPWRDDLSKVRPIVDRVALHDRAQASPSATRPKLAQSGTTGVPHRSTLYVMWDFDVCHGSEKV